MTRIELSLRGLPEWLIREYLHEMGAVPVNGQEASTEMQGRGWSVTWSSQRVQIPGSKGIGLTQFDMVFTGADSATQEAHDRFMKKAQRGGG